MAEGVLEDVGVLVVIREPGRVAMRLAVSDVVEVGRDCTGLLLADPQISRRHLALCPDGPSSVMVTDLGSSNGTTVDGVRLSAPRLVGPGELVCFGSCTLEIAAGAPARRDLRRDTSIGRVAAAVTAGRNDLSLADADGGNVTIVFSEIEGATRRAEELGEAPWVEALTVHNAIVRRHLGRHRGTEVTTHDDGFMLRFASVRSAIACMVSVLQALAMHNASHPQQAVRVRVGIHTAAPDDNGHFGRHVEMAARVAAEARGSEILASSSARELLETDEGVAFGESRSVTLAGFPGSHRVHPVVWGPDR